MHLSKDQKNVAIYSEEILPVGWTVATIGELIDGDGVFVDGDWVESKDQDPLGKVRLIQLADIGDGEYRDKSARFLTMERAEELGCTFLEFGDILIARMPDPLGRACIFPGDEKLSVTVVDVCIIRPGQNSVDYRWLMHTINAPEFRRAIFGLQNGTTRQRISRSNLAIIEFPIPPLPEQTRIVAAIEQQFTRIDAAVASLQSARAKTKQYRVSLLKAAVEGELTREWREGHPTGEAGAQLLARILAERRARWEEKRLAEMLAKGKPPKDDAWKLDYKEPQGPDVESLPGLPEGWCYTFLEPLLAISRKGMVTGPFGSLLKKHEHRANGVPVFGIENIAAMKFVAGNKIYITQDKSSELSQYEALPGDVLISRSGTVGEVCVVPEGLGEARISTNLIRVSLTKNGMIPQFFCLLFNGSPFVLDQVSELCKGSTRDFLSQTILSQIIFPLPPLAEQAQIVAEVEAKLSDMAQVEVAIENNLKRAEQERQSILREAFAGRLVEQDAGDEPASVLLERIREERARREIVEKARRKGERKMAMPKKDLVYKTNAERLYHTLAESGKSLEPGELFRQAGFKVEEQPESVEVFEMALTPLELAGAIVEDKPNDSMVLLRAMELPEEQIQELFGTSDDEQEDDGAELEALEIEDDEIAVERLPEIEQPGLWED